MTSEISKLFRLIKRELHLTALAKFLRIWIFMQLAMHSWKPHSWLMHFSLKLTSLEPPLVLCTLQGPKGPRVDHGPHLHFQVTKNEIRLVPTLQARQVSILYTQWREQFQSRLRFCCSNLVAGNIRLVDYHYPIPVQIGLNICRWQPLKILMIDFGHKYVKLPKYTGAVMDSTRQPKLHFLSTESYRVSIQTIFARFRKFGGHYDLSHKGLVLYF